MILSHKLRMIFIKTKKVGGTSFEIAMSKFCAEQDVITPIADKDEELRNSLGYRGAQNHQNKKWYFRSKKRRKLFYNHISAEEVRGIIGQTIWDDYKKITIYRNPFDAIISRYYYLGAEKTGLSFEDFVLNNRKALLENSKIAPLSGPFQLNHYVSYHRMQSELKTIGLSHIGDEILKINAKGSYRPKNGTSIEEMYFRHPRIVDFICEACAEEIAHFNFVIPDL